jgi:peptide chain release factor 3
VFTCCITIHLIYSPQTKQKLSDEIIEIEDLNDPDLPELIGKQDTKKLQDDVELINEVFEPFDVSLYREGYLAPVFFGSAVNNFGIQELLDTFVEIAPAPLPRETSTGMIKCRGS